MLDTLKFKDFYLRVKIANIRKRLTENKSLNEELCIDKKTYPDLINVKLMVKALEELAEEEQKLLLEEEKEAAAKKAEEAAKKDTVDSDVETPRSGEKKDKEGSDKKDKDSPNEKEAKELSESYGVDIMKFGNASIRSKSNTTHSPLFGERQFVQLNTIEEDKHETQTSNYFENASEREDSKLLGSN